MENLTEKERMIKILESEERHWKYLEKGIGISPEIVAKKIGGIRAVKSYIENHA